MVECIRFYIESDSILFGVQMRYHLVAYVTETNKTLTYHFSSAKKRIIRRSLVSPQSCFHNDFVLNFRQIQKNNLEKRRKKNLIKKETQFFGSYFSLFETL